MTILVLGACCVILRIILIIVITVCSTGCPEKCVPKTTLQWKCTSDFKSERHFWDIMCRLFQMVMCSPLICISNQRELVQTY